MLEPTRLKICRRLTQRGAISLTFILLFIEFYDEFVYAVGYSARPALRGDLGLSYAQVGLLLGFPHLINTIIEPVLMLLGDTRLRKWLVLGGGAGMALSAILIAGAQAFPIVLLAEILSFPSSGAFVTLSQATLMDLNPGREPHSMARWSASGSLANLIAPLLVAGGFGLALGWRWAVFFQAIWKLCSPVTTKDPRICTRISLNFASSVCISSFSKVLTISVRIMLSL